jgi:serine/threonine-protein kinase
MIPPDLPELIGGKYRPMGVIGVGAMGVVYSVEHVLTGEQLALKVMTSHHGATREAIERFKREARASSKIRSEHVVRIIDADVAPELDRAPYLVMDLLEGTDLEKASGDEPIAPVVVVEWLRQVARALDKAHRLGITHRDLKPENLFLTQREDGSPLIKILDFGIAKITAESTGTTQSGQILGTPLYMSPEQARGDPTQIGPAADRYALGLIAYKLLTGAPYWKATSVAGIIGQVLYEPMTAPSTGGCRLGGDFDQWFLRACNREPSQRFGTTVEQVEALAKAIGLPADMRAESLKSNPGASGNSPAPNVSDKISTPGVGASARQSHPETSSGIDLAAATLAQSGGTLVSSSSETAEFRVQTITPRRRRTVFYSVMSAAALLSVLTVMFYRREPAPAAPLAKPAAATPTETRAVAVDIVPPSPPPAAPSVPPLVESGSPKKEPPPVLSPVAPAGPGKPKGMAKPSPAHSGGVSGALRTDKAVSNDPLGDQK